MRLIQCLILYHRAYVNSHRDIFIHSGPIAPGLRNNIRHPVNKIVTLPSLVRLLPSIVLNENNFREIARSSGTVANYERIVDSAQYEVFSLHNDIKKCSQVELVEGEPNAPNLGQHLILFVAPVCVFVYPHFIENTHPRCSDE